MFKTILKTVALSATTLTLLSACGATEALNAAINAYEASLNENESSSGSSAFLSVGSGEESDSESDSKNDSKSDSKLKLGEIIGISEALTEEEIDAYFKKIDDVKYTDKIVDAKILGKINYRDENEEEEINLDNLSFIELIELGLDPYEDPTSDYYRTTEETRLIDEALFAERARWQRLELWNAKHEPVTGAVHVASVGIKSITPTPGDVRTIAGTKTNDTFKLVTGENDTAIMTINGVDYEIMANPNSGHGAWYIPNPNRKVSDNKATLSSSGAISGNVRKIVNGVHPTVQGDYFKYRTGAEDFYANENLDYTIGFATIGTQTAPTVVESQTAVAIYRGQGRLHTYIDLNQYNSYSQQAPLGITMSVDFDANTIEGTGRRKTGNHYEFSPANVIFNSAPIDGNGFSGTFTLNSEMREWYDLADNPTGYYDGNFFGPNADDLAGVMRFEGTETEGADWTGRTHGDATVVGIGGFRADRH